MYFHIFRVEKVENWNGKKGKKKLKRKDNLNMETHEVQAMEPCPLTF